MQSSAICIYTVTFEPIQDSYSSKGPKCGSSPLLDIVFHFTLDKLEKAHGDFKDQINVSETEVMDISAKVTVQCDCSNSYKNWPCTFKCVSSAQNPKDSASCGSAWPQNRLHLNRLLVIKAGDSPQQGQILQLMKQKQWFGQCLVMVR